MTAREFRRIALALEGAEERAHMGHPDFRVNGKIFATLKYPDEGWGMVKLPPADQDRFMRECPGVFVPCNGAWGRQGCTSVLLKAVKADVLTEAIRAAGENARSGKGSKPARRPSKPPLDTILPRKTRRNKRAR